MIKNLTLALMLAATITVSAAPAADAGPLRDKLRGVATKVAEKGLSAANCVHQAVTGRPMFFRRCGQ